MCLETDVRLQKMHAFEINFHYHKVDKLLNDLKKWTPEAGAVGEVGWRKKNCIR